MRRRTLAALHRSRGVAISELYVACGVGKIEGSVGLLCEPPWPGLSPPHTAKADMQRPFTRHLTLAALALACGLTASPAQAADPDPMALLTDAAQAVAAAWTATRGRP